MLTGEINLHSLVASKARLNAALQRQRPGRLHCTNGAPLTLLAIQWFRNAPFHDLLFGVNEIRLDGKTGFVQETRVRQYLCNRAKVTDKGETSALLQKARFSSQC